MGKSKWNITARKQHGAPYVVHTLYAGGKVIWSQIGPISEQEAVARIEEHERKVAAGPPPKWVFRVGHSKPGPKPGRNINAWPERKGDQHDAVQGDPD